MSRQKANQAKRNIQAVSTHIASLQTHVLALQGSLLAQPSSKSAAQDAQDATAELADLATCTAATIDSLLAGVASTIDKICNDPLPSEANQRTILQQQQEPSQQAAKLNRIISAMRREAADVTATYESDRRHMHLGQIAKVLDAAAVEYTGYNFQRATLDDIQDASTAGQLPNLEQQHWEEFQEFLMCTYGCCEDALHVARTLRSNARTVTLAHADEFETVTKADLLVMLTLSTVVS